MKKIFRFLCLSLFWMLAAIPAGADEEENLSIKTESRLIASSTIDDVFGEIEISESKFSATYGYNLPNLLPITLGFNIKHTEINEDLAAEYPSHLEARSFQVGTKFPIPFMELENYYMGVDVFPTMNTDGWEWEDSAFRMPFRTYLIYKPEEKFILVAGVSVRIDYDDTVLPLFGLIYKPNDRLSFNLASDNPNVSYKLNDQFTTFAEFDYARDEYEVTQNGQKGVILKYRQSSAGAGLKYEPTKFLEASVATGLVLGRRIEYEDSSDKIEPESAPYVKAALELKF